MFKWYLLAGNMCVCVRQKFYSKLNRVTHEKTNHQRKQKQQIQQQQQKLKKVEERNSRSGKKSEDNRTSVLIFFIFCFSPTLNNRVVEFHDFGGACKMEFGEIDKCFLFCRRRRCRICECVEIVTNFA